MPMGRKPARVRIDVVVDERDHIGGALPNGEVSSGRRALIPRSSNSREPQTAQERCRNGVDRGRVAPVIDHDDSEIRIYLPCEGIERPY
jgi:hypothetical protein